MSYDGITMAAVRKELEQKLSGARVDKIYQPRKQELYLHLRSREGAYTLVCSADARFARVHLTREKQDNPASPPPFCMLLRKHLTGARLLAVDQVGLDRVLIFTFRAHEDLGTEPKRILICEIMGKHSNVILAEPDFEGQWIILGSIRTVSGSMSRYRAVSPGEFYKTPPAQQKPELDEITEEILYRALAAAEEGPPEKMLVGAVMGPGLEMARELYYRAAGGDTPHPLEIVRPLTIELNALSAVLRDGAFTPCIACPPGHSPVFSPIVLTRFPPECLSRYESVNEAYDDYFRTVSGIREQSEQALQLSQVLNSRLNRLHKKHSLQQQEIALSEDAERCRLFGEMLTANLHRFNKPGNEVLVTNYYSPTQESLVIPLNPALSIQDNAKTYFKKYRKLKDGETFHRQRLAETTLEIAYLESLQSTLAHADSESIIEIREEMEISGLLAPRRERNKKRPALSLPMHFVSEEGIDIYVGKNNLQNDRLTLKTASPNDTWLHTKDVPGAHVIVKSADPPGRTLNFAARLAVRFSRAFASSNVPVDYTLVKHVRKPRGARPGMVIYDHHRTLFVTDGD